MDTRHFWQAHDAHWRVDREADPEALGNVNHAGASRAMNLSVDRALKRTFDRLLPPGPGDALDVGCGGGRWTRRLMARGYRVVGIDLQPSLIAENSRLLPEARFECVPAEEVEGGPFDLISTVAVLQHNPPDAQVRILRHLRGVMRPGGHFLALENLTDHLPHVFAHSRDEWVRLFGEAGFRLVQHLPGHYCLARRALRLGTRDGNRASVNFARRAAIATDTAIEPVLQALRAPLPTYAGMLYRAE